MREIDIINAYDSFRRVLSLSLPYPVIKKIRKLYVCLNDEVEFYVEEEKKLIKKYARKNDEDQIITDNDGRIQFDDENYKLYQEDHLKLDNLGVEVDPCVITSDMMGEQICTARDVLLLEGIINFTDEESDIR